MKKCFQILNVEKTEKVHLTVYFSSSGFRFFAETLVIGRGGWQYHREVSPSLAIWAARRQVPALQSLGLAREAYRLRSWADRAEAFHASHAPSDPGLGSNYGGV